MFRDRKEAGQKLVPELEQYKNSKEVVVLGLPRGGAVVACEVAEGLNLPLDLIVPRKIGAPGNPEFAIGAITEEGVGVFDEKEIQTYKISQEYIENEVAKEKQEAQRRLKTYRGEKPPLDLKDKIAILVDDGIATGATMRAAIKSAKAKGAKKVVVAVPVSAKDALKLIEQEADEVVYIDAPMFFMSVGQFYKFFPQTPDEEVIELMKKSKSP